MKTIEYTKEQVKFLPNLPRYEPLVMDSTAYKTLLDCRRRYFYRFVLGRDVKVNKYQLILDWGTAFHKFKELLELAGFNKAITFATGVTLPFADPKTKFGFLDQRRFMKMCMKAYDIWKEEKEKGKVEVLAVEQAWNVLVPGTEDLYIGGRFDQLVKWMGNLWDRDWKTSTKDKATFSLEKDPDDQAIRYIVGGSFLGKKVEGVLFDVMYNAKTIENEHYIVNSTRNEFQKEQWLDDHIHNHRALKIMREEDKWPMDMHGKCNWCPYQRVCKSMSQGSMESVLKSEFKLNPWDFENHGNDSE